MVSLPPDTTECGTMIDIGEIRGLSIKQPWADMIASEEKIYETRTWKTSYRGYVLIVSSKIPANEGLAGHALCVARIIDCRRMTVEDEDGACCYIYHKANVFVLQDVRRVKPFRVRGGLGLYPLKRDVISQIEFIDEE